MRQAKVNQKNFAMIFIARMLAIFSSRAERSDKTLRISRIFSLRATDDC
jgi:hypothetical protein